MTDKRSGAKDGVPSAGKANSGQLDDARQALPGLVRDSGLFDLDYDPSELARMNQIFEYLPDQTVFDLSKRLEVCYCRERAGFRLPFQAFGISPPSKLLESLVEGLTVVAHAERAGISVNTARTHMRRLMEKTGTSGQLDLIRLAHVQP
jgi:hypothetical protein